MTGSKKTRRLAICLLLGVLLLGCQRSQPVAEQTPQFADEVTGVVLLQGQPLANARVLFIPMVYAYRPKSVVSVAWGRTDADGKYALTCYDEEQRPRRGAPVGRHWVLISKLENPPESTPKDYWLAQVLRPTWGVRARIDPQQELVPPKYNVNSELTTRILTTDPVRIDFHLE